MSQFNRTADQLIATLEMERNALLSGAYDALPAIMEKKERFAALLDQQTANPNDALSMKTGREKIDRIRSLSDVNGKLLLAAKTGAHSAKARIGKIMNRENTVGTYTQNGSKLHAKEAFITQQKLA